MGEAVVDGATSFARSIALGLAHRERGDWTAAIEEFSDACRGRPGDLGARCELAFTQVQSGGLDDARAIYLSVYSEDPSNTSALAGLADISRRRGSLQDALKYLQEAIALEPARVGLQVDCADIHRRLGRYDEARTILRRVLLHDPANWGAFIGLGLLARQRGDAAASAALFRHALIHQPNHLGTGLELALSLRLAGLEESAEEVYRSILDRNPEHSEALLGLATLMRGRGQAALAVELLRTTSARSRTTALRLELAAALRELAQLDEAHDEYMAILEQAPNDWTALLGRALTARQRGDHAASLADFQAAAGLQPHHVGLQCELALALLLVKRLDEAEAIYHNALAQDPEAGAALQGLSVVAAARSDLAAAVQLAEAALERSPRNVERMTFLSALHRDSGRMDEAGALIDRALAIEPDNNGAWIEKGLQLRQRADRAGALAAFQRVAPLDIRASIEAAVEHLALGHPQTARAAYLQILAVQPFNYSALLAMTEMEMRAGNYRRCIEICAELIARYPKLIAPYRQKCRALIQLDRAEEAVSILREITAVDPHAADADAARLETFRITGMRVEAQTLLASAPIVSATSFDLRFERLLTRLAFFDVAGARMELQSLGAFRPFERSRYMYAQGILADIEWRIADSIRWFDQALTLHAEDPGAHHHLARLHFLRADADSAGRHLRLMIQQSRSSLSMRGESTNISQNLLGQLLNELRLDAALQARLSNLAALDCASRVENHTQVVREAPSFTPSAICLMLALRQAGAFSDSARRPRQGAQLIPRTIMQYWDQQAPPPAISRLLRTWAEAHPGYGYFLFHDASAGDYLSRHYPPEVRTAYERARHPAQASDIFRLAYLLREGGFYIDADDRCVGNLDALSRPGDIFIGYQEQYATLGNNFIACMPGEPVIDRALALALETLLRDDSEAIWLATGPGLLTRAFAEELCSLQDGRRSEWLMHRHILERSELSKVSWSHSISYYKNTHRGWLRSAFKGSGHGRR